MGRDNVMRFSGGGGSGPRRPPEHFKPAECRAWSDIVGALAPLHFTEEVDHYYLELAAATLASFRAYAPFLDDLTRARHSQVLQEILEEALVPAAAIPELLKV